MSWNAWSEEETKFLIKNSHRMTAKEIAAAIDRSEVSVWSKARYLKKTGRNIQLQKSGTNHHLTTHTNDDVELCRALNDNGLTYRTIAKKMEIPLGTVQEWCSYRSRLSA